MARLLPFLAVTLIGTLSNDDDDACENFGKK